MKKKKRFIQIADIQYKDNYCHYNKSKKLILTLYSQNIIFKIMSKIVSCYLN
jgi:hypothetical protein